MIKNPLKDLQDTLKKINSTEGMSQYILMTFAEDIIISPDLIVVALLNSKSNGLDILDLNLALNAAQRALEGGLNKDMVSVEVSGNKIKFRPKIKNEHETTEAFVGKGTKRVYCSTALTGEFFWALLLQYLDMSLK